MECKFVIGQKVVCVRAVWNNIFNHPDAPAGAFEVGPKKNEIVTITDIIPYPFDLIGLALKEYPGLAYNHDQFRPLNEKPKETSIEVFKKLLTPKQLEKV